MTVTLADIQADCGEAYDNLNNGTTAATSLLTKAQARIALVTGTSTGYDLHVRNLADAFVCQQLLSSSDSTDQSIGSIKIGRRQLLDMRDYFIKECKSALALSGYKLDIDLFPAGVVNQ